MNRPQHSFWLPFLMACLFSCSIISCSSGVRAGIGATSTKPTLVVSVVLDQLPSWLLENALGHLDPKGAIRTTLERGAYHHRVAYEYATTFTAPGHAAIYTGAPPRLTGIVGNRRWDAKQKRVRSSLDDQKHRVLGVKDDYASIHALRIDGVAERLAYTKGKVVSLSIKDRGAILAAGRKPELVLWYEAEAKGFTTSTYYGKELPAWLLEWQNQHPLTERFTTWAVANPQKMEIVSGADNAVGEDGRFGASPMFPHEIAKTTDPAEALVFSPMSTEMLLELATESVDQLELGADEHTDLLAISVSGTDYVGHVYGPNSWEALDNLIRVDRALGVFFAALEKKVSLAWVITSDHGVAPLPERSRALGLKAHRVDPKHVAQVLDAALDTTFGAFDWVEAFVDTSLFLAPILPNNTKRTAVVRKAIDVLKTTEGLAHVFAVQEAKQWSTSKDWVRRAVALSLPADYAADIVVIPAPYSILSEYSGSKGSGTTHGTPWFYDTEVPVLMAGKGVSRVETTDALAQNRVAATLSALLGVKPPTHGRKSPLPGLAR